MKQVTFFGWVVGGVVLAAWSVPASGAASLTSERAKTAKQDKPDKFVLNEFIVVLKRDVRARVALASDEEGKPTASLPTLDASLAQADATRFVRQFPTAKFRPVDSKYPDLTGHYKVKIEPGADLDAAMQVFAADPTVDHVEKIGVHFVTAVPNDPFYGGLQYHLQPGPGGMDAETAWDTETGDPSVVVGILDTGTEYFHRDLGGDNATWGPGNPQTNGNIFVNPGETPGDALDNDGNGRVDDTIGFDFIASGVISGCTCIDADCGGADNDPIDFNGHGTWTGGIVGAITNNSRVVAGVAGGFSAGASTDPGNGVKVLPLRVCLHANCGGFITGVCRMDSTAEAMNYVADLVDLGINVTAVNASFGTSNTGGLDAATDNLLAHDVMIMKAAGNDNNSFADFLGSKPGVMVAGGTDSAGNGYSSSSFGAWVDIAAPAVNVRTTSPGGGSLSVTGTSFSAPNCAGVAALLESCEPSLTAQQKFDIMVATTNPYTDPRPLGSGIANAKNAVDLACGQDQKFVQPPEGEGEDIPSNIDWSDSIPNVVLADDFVSDGRPIDSVTWWGSELGESAPFILDDGAHEDAIGVNDGTNGSPFGWANRFQNTTGGPITIKSLDVGFGTGGTGVSVGDAADAVIWIDAAVTGNLINAVPALRWVIPGGVDHPFMNITVPGGGVVIPAGADFYVGLLDIQSGIDGVMRFPAAIDDTASQGQSWAYFYDGTTVINETFQDVCAGGANDGLDCPNGAGDCPGGTCNSVILDTIDNFGLPGNWLIRAHTVPAEVPDGWFISFHEPLPLAQPPAPPLGLYFCDELIVDSFDTTVPSCDGHPVIHYMVDLADCCLIHSNADSRDASTPAQPGVFNEVECFDYAIDIQAVIGVKFVDNAGTCDEVPTGRSVAKDFWGWHTTDREQGVSFGLQQALASLVTMSPPDWLYGPWNPVVPTCSQPNTAFALKTNTLAPGNPDLDDNGVPDICECTAPAPVLAEPTPVDKNRYLSFVPQNAGLQTAIRVTLTNLPGFPAFNGQIRWVGPPSTACTECDNITTFTSAVLQGTQNCMDWGPVGLVDVYGIEVVPGSTYDVEVIECPCDPGVPVFFSPPLTIQTQKWGDVVTPFGGGGQPAFGDISTVVDCFRCIPTALRKARCQLKADSADPCANVDFADISLCVDAFRGDPYPFSGP